jgi:hypothetical protein
LRSRFDVGRVSPADHQVGLLDPAGGHVGGELQRRVDVVVEHGPALRR